MRTHPLPPTIQLPASRTHWDALRWPLAWGMSLIATLTALAGLAAAYHPPRISVPQQLHAELGHIAAPTSDQVEPSERPQPTHPQTRQAATTPSHPAANTLTPAQASPSPTPTPSPAEVAAITQANSAEPHAGTTTVGAISPATPTNAPATGPGKGAAGAVGAGASAPPRDAQAPLSIRCPTQIKPAFPKLALEDSINHGEVRARLHLDAEGHVANVEILEASPAGYFENAVRKSALQWRCQGNGQADSIVVPFSFQAR